MFIAPDIQNYQMGWRSCLLRYSLLELNLQGNHKSKGKKGQTPVDLPFPKEWKTLKLKCFHNW